MVGASSRYQGLRAQAPPFHLGSPSKQPSGLEFVICPPGRGPYQMVKYSFQTIIMKIRGTTIY